MTKIVFPAAYRLGKLQPSFREVPVYSHSWHKRNLARITGEGEGQNQQWVLGTLRSGQVRKRGKIDLKQSLIYIIPLSPTLPNFSLFAHLQPRSQKTILR